MNQADFKLHMARLGDQFKGTYTQARVELIWDAVKDLDVSWWASSVDHFIGSSRQPPLMTEFKEFAAQEREKLWARQKQTAPVTEWKANPNCDWCSDNGTYVCRRKGHGGVWAFRCHCSKGTQDPRRQIPQFKQDHSREFTYYDISQRSL